MKLEVLLVSREALIDTCSRFVACHTVAARRWVRSGTLKCSHRAHRASHRDEASVARNRENAT